MTHKAPPLPKKLYVRWNTDANEPFLEAAEAPDHAEDGDQVGVYTLTSTHRMQIERTLK